MQIYCIAGTFFQRSCHPADSDDSGYTTYFFSGYLQLDKEVEKGEGQLIDSFGAARIVVTKCSDDELIFTKRYSGGGDKVHYTFTKRSDGTWSGHYAGLASGEGHAWCELRPLPSTFLAPDVLHD